MKKTVLIAFTIIFSFLLLSCSKKDDGPQPEPQGPVRTVLVYMVASNSLGQFGYDTNDLHEMEEAARQGQLGDARWLVYYHPYDQVPRLMELQEDGNWVVLRQYATETLSVTVARMKEVLNDTRTMAPAQSYGLVLWSHATGWLQNGVADRSIAPRSFGDDRGRYMNITSLAEALENADLDYIYADCCYMACVEVAYQLRNCADYLVASAAELPANGMDYSQNMKCLTAAKPDLVGAARNTYNTYAPYNSNPNKSWCTMSVIDLSRMDALAAATLAIYKSGAYPERFEPQTFTAGTNYYSDLAQFVERVALQPVQFANWTNDLSQTVLYSAATPYIIGSIPVTTHCGLTTYILSSKTDNNTRNYRQLDWYNEVAVHQPLP